MRMTQFFIMEPGPACNYASRHPECPIKDPRRWEFLDTRQKLTEDKMVELGIEVYQKHGFTGYVGAHYYNEPLLYRDLILRTYAKIKAACPQARFVLWSNGSLITPEKFEDLAIFDKIVITDYDKTDFSFLKPMCKDLYMAPVAFDNRRDVKEVVSRQRCVRPFTELIVDCHGNVHICCVDWQGKATPGNVFNEPFTVILDRFREIRNRVAGPQMAEDAPKACLECHRRWGHIDNYVPAAQKLAEAACQELARQANQARQVQRYRRGRPVPRVSIIPPKPPKPVTPDDTVLRKAWERSGGWVRPKPLHIALPRRAPQEIGLYAVIGTWHEGDIIEACVKNCLAQGCERVYILDNDSPDDTVEVAKAAGAEIVEVYHTDFYSEGTRLHKMNGFMERITMTEKRSRMWWLALDADEFPAAPNGLTLREWVSRQENHFNVLGAWAFDHYPHQPLANIRGFHPAEFQPYGMLRWDAYCGLSHWKHSLLRYDDGVFNLAQTYGMHTTFGRQNAHITEPIDQFLMNHFMYRNYADTLKRLEAICGADPHLGGNFRAAVDEKQVNNQGSLSRFRHLEQVYSQKWDEVEMPHSRQLPIGRHGIPVAHWSHWPQLHTFAPRRWYEQAALEKAITAANINTPTVTLPILQHG
jgi:hypothetical protein